MKRYIRFFLIGLNVNSMAESAMYSFAKEQKINDFCKKSGFVHSQ